MSFALLPGPWDDREIVGGCDKRDIGISMSTRLRIRVGGQQVSRLSPLIVETL